METLLVATLLDCATSKVELARLIATIVMFAKTLQAIDQSLRSSMQTPEL